MEMMEDSAISQPLDKAANVASYSDEFHAKVINDPIYGCINLSEMEVRLLDTRAMQRLRRIRQMGFASYVFPSGEHSRFVHSLGVLCIMGKMCDHLLRRYGSGSDGNLFTVEDARLLRAAALLHDVGHFPFSHLGECVYGFIENIDSSNAVIEGLSTAPASNNPRLLSDLANYKKKKSKDHEHMGAAVIRGDPEIAAILKEAGIDQNQICSIITGDTAGKPLYAQLLHSSLDADRLDYLLRDSRQAGVVFGQVELDYILRQMRIHKDISSGTGDDMIVFDERAQHAIEHFLLGRYFHYTQVVFHKTTLAFESVAKALVYLCLQQSQDCAYKSYDEIVQHIGKETFYCFTDDYMWQLLNRVAASSKDPYFQDLWRVLHQRKKPKAVWSTTDILPKSGTKSGAKPIHDSSFFLTRWLLDNQREQLAAEAGIPLRQIGYVTAQIHLESIPSHMRFEDYQNGRLDDSARDAIRLINKDGVVYFLASDDTSLINKMVDFTSDSLYVFVIGDVSEDHVRKLQASIQEKSRA